jgi:hypothetical protein
MFGPWFGVWFQNDGVVDIFSSSKDGRMWLFSEFGYMLEVDKLDDMYNMIKIER